MLLSGLTALLLVIGVVIYTYYEKKQYMKTEYFIQTQNDFFKMRRDSGLYGEFLIYDRLKGLPITRKFLFNTYLPKDNGQTTEVDTMMITEYGIIVFESKNYSGWIFGTETQKNWTQCLKGNGRKAIKTHFYNPIMQNKSHIKYLKEAIKDFGDIPIFSYIVFSDRCELKNITLSTNSNYVIKRTFINQIVSEQLQTLPAVVTADTINSLYNRLYDYTQVSDAIKTQHIADIQGTPAPFSEMPRVISGFENTGYNQTLPVAPSQSLTVQKRYCPKCGNEMVLRTAKRGNNAGKQFWGCSGFPSCRYVSKYDISN